MQESQHIRLLLFVAAVSSASLPQRHYHQQHQTLSWWSSKAHAHQGLHAGPGARCGGPLPGDPPWLCTPTQQFDSLTLLPIRIRQSTQRDTQWIAGSEGCAQKGNRPEYLLRIMTSVNCSLHTCLPLEDSSRSSSLCKGLLSRSVWDAKVSVHFSTLQSCTSSLKTTTGPSLVMSAKI